MKHLAFILVLPFWLVSCATAPSGPSTPSTIASAPTPSPPDWISRSTYMEGPNLVFVLAGLETASVQELALQSMRAYLDLPVTSTTSVVAAQAIQKFLDTVSATVPSDRYTKGGQGWWKVAVPKAIWDQSRAQLLPLLNSTPSAPSAGLELAADELARQGRYYDAMNSYVAAAASAEAKSSRFKSSLQKAQDLLSSLTLSSVTPSQSTLVGKPFSATFDVRLTLGSGAQAVPVVGVPLRFSYRVLKNGRPAVTGQTVKTDAQGLVQFELPVPDFASRDSLVVLVDVNPWMEALASVPKEGRDPVSRFETLASERRLLLPYTVESASKQIPMIVALADFDDRGSVLRRQESTSVLIAALQKAGFQTSGIPVNPTLLKSSNDSVILAAWKFQGKTSGRAVYGTLSLVSVTASGSQYQAEVSGLLKVADLATSKPVYQWKSSKTALAGDKTSATAAAFRAWASDAAATLEAELP